MESLSSINNHYDSRGIIFMQLSESQFLPVLKAQFYNKKCTMKYKLFPPLLA